MCFHLFRQGRTRGFLIMAVIADPLCSLPSLCQRLSEQNVCMDEGVPFSLPCISVFMLSSVGQRLCICIPCETDAEYEHLHQNTAEPKWVDKWWIVFAILCAFLLELLLSRPQYHFFDSLILLWAKSKLVSLGTFMVVKEKKILAIFLCSCLLYEQLLLTPRMHKNEFLDIWWIPHKTCVIWMSFTYSTQTFWGQ